MVHPFATGLFNPNVYIYSAYIYIYVYMYFYNLNCEYKDYKCQILPCVIKQISLLLFFVMISDTVIHH